jgi:hypothetical protein
MDAWLQIFLKKQSIYVCLLRLLDAWIQFFLKNPIYLVLFTTLGERLATNFYLLIIYFNLLRLVDNYFY